MIFIHMKKATIDKIEYILPLFSNVTIIIETTEGSLIIISLAKNYTFIALQVMYFVIIYQLILYEFFKTGT